MQEEVENRTVNLAISTSKLTLRTIVNGFRKFLEHRNHVKAVKKNQKYQREQNGQQGKQTVKQLIGQNQGVSNIDIAKTELRGFERIARKYGVDFAVVREKGVKPPKYHIFFKVRDVDAITAMYKELSAKTLKKSKRPSVLETLKKFKVIVEAHVGKVREKSHEREQQR